MRGGPPKQGDRHSGSGEPRGKQGTQRTRADDEGFHETTTALRLERVPADRNRLLTGHHDPSRQSWQAGGEMRSSCDDRQLKHPADTRQVLRTAQYLGRRLMARCMKGTSACERRAEARHMSDPKLHCAAGSLTACYIHNLIMKV